ncbi:MAG: DNA polymerase Y family protein [Gammaproteobacteria bacterium]|nr:DNA polymerase Y family protein [Gammaproteobacteria bacterium]
MLWLAVHFPLFGLEVCCPHGLPETPAALIEDSRVRLCNQAALDAGIGLSSTLATAHGIHPSITHHQRNPASETQRLELLAEMCYRFTSQVSLEPPNGLLLEVSGSLNLFGRIDVLQRQVAELCRTLGHQVELSTAQTPSAALALSRSKEPQSGRQGGLAGVPLACTELSAKAVERFANMGITTLGPLLKLPEAELGQRFGTQLIHYLQRLTGAAPDPRIYITPQPTFASSLHFLEAITDKDALLFPMQRLLTELQQWLVTYQLGAERLIWHFATHDPATRISMPVRFANAQQQKSAFLDISRLKLDQIELPEDVLTVGLAAKRLVAWRNQSHVLFENLSFGADQPGQSMVQSTELIDQLNARLGPQGCLGIRTTEQHEPEHAWQNCRPGTSAGPNDRAQTIRPLWFFLRPLRVERDTFTVLRGPERLQAGWWRDGSGIGRDTCRDYYVVEHRNGAQCWAFLEPNGRWFLHGYFA